MKKKRNKTTNLKDEAHSLLFAKAESTGETMMELASGYISKGVSWDLQDEGWEERIKKSIEDLEIQKKKKKTQILISEKIGIDKCDGLVKIEKRIEMGKEKGEIKETYICVKGSSTGTVKLKKLGVAPTKICDACKKTMNLEVRWTQIRAKDKLGVEEHTYCLDGGWYDDKTGRIHCKRMDRWQNQEVCFSIAHGKSCPSLKTLPARRVKRTGIQRRKR